MRLSASRLWHATVAVCLGLMVAGTAACTVRAAGNEPAPDSDTRRAEVVRTGCQGGITGGGNGVRIDADDQVVRWSRTFAGGPEETADMGADPVLAAEVRQQLDAAGFTAIDYDKPANMTCFVRYRDHIVAWPIGDTDAPAAVVAVHQRLSGLP